MGKKFFVVPWISACLCVPCVLPAESESAVETSAGKLIKVEAFLAQCGLEATCSGTGTPIGNGIIVVSGHLFQANQNPELQRLGFNDSQPMERVFTGHYVAGRVAMCFSLQLKKLGKEDDDIATLQVDLRKMHDLLEVTAGDARCHGAVAALYALLTKGIPFAVREPAKDDPVYFAGFPLNGPLAIREGAMFRSTHSDILCHGRADHGMSGGAVLNQDGAAVGFVAATITKNDGGDWVRGPSINTVRELE